MPNAHYNLKIALLLHKMTTANKSPLFLNSSLLVTLQCLTKRKPDKLQEGPFVMDIEGMLTELLQSLYLLCQCFNSTCLELLLSLVLYTIVISQKVDAFPLPFLTLLPGGLYGSVNGQTKWVAINGSCTEWQEKESVIQVSEVYKDKISLKISRLHTSPKWRFLKENKSQVLQYYQKSMQVGS